uniref:Uncharacterized protein n=1 Tax=Leersia perrieri TaxID=77586 RepID=A0A0D9WGP2_9ORYZ
MAPSQRQRSTADGNEPFHPPSAGATFCRDTDEVAAAGCVLTPGREGYLWCRKAWTLVVRYFKQCIDSLPQPEVLEGDNGEVAICSSMQFMQARKAYWQWWGTGVMDRDDSCRGDMRIGHV